MPKRKGNSAVEETPLSFESPESSSIVRADYHPGRCEMKITFRRGTNEVSYLYGGVLAPLWQDFTLAESKGSFFAKAIRPMFAGRPL